MAMKEQTNINKYIPFFERLLSLLIVFLLLSGTVVWSGKIFGRYIGNSATKDTTAVVPLPDAVCLQQLGLQEAELQPLDSAAWTVMGKTGEELGTVVNTALYAKDVTGFAGATPLYLFLTPSHVVKAIAAAENEESPDFFKEASEGIYGQIIGLSDKQVETKQVDAVTGATYSSNAIIKNVKLTLAERAKAANASNVKQPVIGWGKTCAVIAVLLLGIFASCRLRGIKSVRLAILLLNVCVTGFWCGQFLSVSMLRGWVQNGLDPILYLPAVVMLLVAIILPYFKHPHHYCTWACPFGSLQELAYTLPLPKVHVSKGTFKMMRAIRMLVLMVLMLMLWMGVGAGILDYEPFTAFMLTTATPAVLVLASIFVIASIFIPHPWCRCLCPMGTLLELAEDGGKRKNKNSK